LIKASNYHVTLIIYLQDLIIFLSLF